MPFASLAEWLSWLETLHPSAIELGLERVARVQQSLGLENLDSRVVLVAGTNGKGSTAAMLAKLLEAGGNKVGLYTSPHVLKFEERIRIDGRCATADEICKAFSEVDRARNGVSLTYFEFGTLAAACLFRKSAVDFAVLEVGLGGRLDAVNVFMPTLSVITNIALDHQDWLGDSIESIAREKAGIMRRGVACLFGSPEVPPALRECAKQAGAELLCYDSDFTVLRQGKHSWALRTPNSEYHDIRLPALCGEKQIQNAALAITAAEMLLKRTVSAAELQLAMTKTGLPGRMQRVRDNIETIFDVAHNPAAARNLANFLADVAGGKKIVVLLGMLKDKDIKGFAGALASNVVAWHVLPLAGERAASVEMIKSALETVAPTTTVASHESVPGAIRNARQDAAERGCPLLVTGSFQTVGTVLGSDIYCKHLATWD